jgi:hypothetical protein
MELGGLYGLMSSGKISRVVDGAGYIDQREKNEGTRSGEEKTARKNYNHCLDRNHA